MPAKRTIHAVLHRHGLVKGIGRPRARATGTALSAGAAPSDLWCADFKGEFKLGNGHYCYPSTLTDHASRYLLLCEALESAREDTAITAFEKLFCERGPPAAIRSDNGVPFASPNALFNLSKLSVWWLRLGIATQSTAYRYVAQLVRSGFLDPVAGGGYVLGPAFVEFDRRIRLSDPLLQAAQPQVARLRKVVGARASIVVARYYRDRVMCIHIDHASPAAAQVSYERGLPMSPFRGATSKAILASLPDRVLRRLYRTRAQEIATAGMGRDWRTFSAALRVIRDAGYAITRSEVARGRLGIAAPILVDGGVLGSLSVVVAARGVTASETVRIAESVVLTAGRISAALARSHLGPPRLVARRAPDRARASSHRATKTSAKGATRSLYVRSRSPRP